MKISLRDKKISPWDIILFLRDKLIYPWDMIISPWDMKIQNFLMWFKNGLKAQKLLAQGVWGKRALRLSLRPMAVGSGRMVKRGSLKYG